MNSSSTVHGKIKFYCKLTSLFLSEFLMLSEMIPEITAWHDVDHQIQVLSVLVSEVHVHKETTCELITDIG